MSNVSDTIEKIGRYFNSTSQYPLLVVVPPDEYRDILTVFSTTPRIRVSNYCVGPDKEPDTTKLLSDVKNVKGNYLLIGLGNYLASKGDDDARGVLTLYKDLVLQPSSHIVLLLSAHVYPLVKEIVKGDLRAKPRVVLPQYAPIIPTVDSNALVYGIKAYLEACEKGENIGNVKTSRKLTSATVINPESAFDELKHIYPNEFNKLSQSMGSAEYWSSLLEAINKSKKNILQYLAAQNFSSPEYVFLNHAKKKDYTSLLFLIWLKLQTNTQNYLGFVVSKAGSLESLLDTAKTAILDIPISDSRFNTFYEQRKILLKDCNDADMADFVRMVHRMGSDKIAYLTDNTKVEKQAIIVALSEGAKTDYLRNSYLDLYSYLQDYTFSEKGFTEYFSAYKKCKVSNKVDESFAVTVAKNATARPYNSLPPRSSVFSKIGDEKTLLIFLDALGVEFLGFFKDVCAELKIRFVPSIARANLPTITSFNKEFYDEWQGCKEPPIIEIDDLKHHPERGYDYNNSPYPIHLSEELEVIRTALERAKTRLSTGEYRKVIIASDHGASRLAVISEDVQVENNGCESKSSGRYCQGDDLPVAENIAIEKDYAIIADYSRFVGSRAASVEVHGGATLEEVVVPIIELTLIDNNIQVTLENSVIEISYKKIPELIFIITPDCDNVTTNVNGNVYDVEILEKSRFRVVLPDLKKGSYTLDVFEHQNKIASKEFTIKTKGFAERNMF